MAFFDDIPPAEPDEGIEETISELDAPIHEAARHAIELWPVS
jgi:hypothetical protein